MKSIIITYIILFLNLFLIQANENKYDTNKIPEELKKNAKAVIRYENRTFEIISIKNAIEKVDFAITILNENGDHFSKLIEFYGKFQKIRNIRYTIFDKFGEEEKKIRQYEIVDHSAVPGYSLYEDNRVKYINPEYKIYPYTVEYSFEIHHNGLLSYPTWNIYKDYNIAVEKSVFTIVSRTNLIFRKIENNFILNIQKNKLPNGYSWQANNLPALEIEPFSENIQTHIPIIYTAPYNFEIDHYQGNFESWNNFGKWINLLNKDKDSLSVETETKLHELTKNAKNNYDKAKIIYDYLQNNTRYVSIQVGIGGWQPFPAETVDKVGYGDCKALTNYTKAMLKAVGINSHYTLVKAGRGSDSIRSEFPSNQFNHAFLCVPLEQDTIWLECTSQTNPFGYTGGFTDDRDALLITENGGKLVHTPVYEQKINTQHRTANVLITADGNGKAEVHTTYAALQYDNISRILYDSYEDQKKWLYDDIEIPSFEIEKFKIVNHKERIPSAELSLDLQLRNYASLSGSRIFIPLNLMNKRTYVPKKMKDRKTDVVYKQAYIDTDSITYNIPEGYKIEYLPESLSVNTEFGEYSIETNVIENSILYVRNIKMKKGKYPASSYNDFREFLKKIVNTDKQKLVLLKDS